MQMKSAGNPLFLRDAVLDDSLEMLLHAQLNLLLIADPYLSSGKLHQTDLFVLFLVTRHPNITSSRLGHLMGQSKQNLSRHINGLIDKGLLIRARDHIDKRRQLLRSSEKGDLLITQIMSGQRNLLRLAFRDAGPDAVEGFRAVVGALVTNPAGE